MLTKTAARTLQKNLQDYIPKGKALSRDQVARLVFRETTEFEIYHCGTRTGDDIQSGPYYCGAIADFVAPAPEGGIVAICGRHKWRLDP
jgi:hypothetical protein